MTDGTFDAMRKEKIMGTAEIRDMINEVPLDSRGVDRLNTICYYLCEEIDKLRSELNHAANIASCLANGIIPD